MTRVEGHAWLGRRLIAMVITVAMVGGLVLASVSSARNSGCADHKACFWTNTNYLGLKKTNDGDNPGVWLELGSYNGSAKNRFGNRRVAIGNSQGGGIVNNLDCMNAGGDRANLPDNADVYKVGGAGSTCS